MRWADDDLDHLGEACAVDVGLGDRGMAGVEPPSSPGVLRGEGPGEPDRAVATESPDLEDVPRPVASANRYSSLPWLGATLIGEARLLAGLSAASSAGSVARGDRSR